MNISPITFMGKPSNYAVVDKYLSRSAQPLKEDFIWLKNNGVTDVINFRTMTVTGLDFDEKQAVEALDMNYISIPSYTRNPDTQKITIFLDTINQIKQNNGKAHIHCMAGADRTGMYSFIYKMLNGIGSLEENENEWIEKGHNRELYPDLMSQTKDIIKNLKLNYS